MTSTYPGATWLTESGNWPSFSSDGSQVVYTEIQGAPAYQLATVPSAGGSITPLDTGLWAASRPDWSWNPDTIAFTGQYAEGAHADLWLIDADGSNCRVVPQYAVPGNILYPSWYQDLTSVVVANYWKEKGKTQVRLLQIQFESGGGTITTPLTSIADVTAGRPSVNPDGTAVVFAGTKGPYNQQDNQLWTVVPPNTPTQLNPGQARSPNWSPDGQWIVFESNAGSPAANMYAIFIISASGGTPTQISDFSYYGPHPEWSRDQSQIVFGGPPVSGIGIIDTPPEFQMS